MVKNPIILHEKARSHTAAAVMDLLCLWQWEILGHPPYSPNTSPCDYDLFTKVKEPLRGTWYNARELIRAIGRSTQNINEDRCDDDVRRLPNSWQKVINKGGGTILKIYKCCTPVKKAMSKIYSWCYFSSNPCTKQITEHLITQLENMSVRGPTMNTILNLIFVRGTA